MTWALKDPGRAAIRSGARELSYGELAERVDALAGNLREQPCAVHGRPVALLADDKVDFLIAFLGIVRAGGIAAPLSSRWTMRQQRQALDVLAPAGILRCTTSGMRLEQCTDDVPAERPEGGTDAPFYIGFSSGSTGRPKAIVRSHRAWVQSFFAMSIEFDIHPQQAVLVPGDLFFSFSLIAALHGLFIGATVVADEQSSLAELIALAKNVGGALYAVPSWLAETSRRAENRSVVCREVTQVICAGEKLRADTRRSAGRLFPEAQLYEYYGASELGFVTVLDDEGFAGHPDSVGRAFLGSRVAILDETGAELPSGEVGLLCARTQYGALGYWNGSGDESALDHFGWGTAGDLAARDEDGYIRLVGRRDNMVVIKGQNIYPEEVEGVLKAMPGVVDAVVVPTPSADPRHLVALVVTLERAPGFREHLLRQCRREIAGIKCPRRIEFVDALPPTATGKLDRPRAASLIDEVSVPAP